MLKFLFWNLHLKDLQSRIATLVERYGVDVVVLAECAAPDAVLANLDAVSGSRFAGSFTLLDRLCVLSRREYALHTLEEEPAARVSMRQLILPSGVDLLLVAMHLPSKLHWSDASQAQNCPRLAESIRRQERWLGHSRTVILGDLNMNPFEPGVVSCHGFHATHSRRVAERQSRTVQGIEYPFFYNPMWGHFGDALDGPAGTYYDSGSEPVAYFWHMFDQVLLRPSLLSNFNREELRILDSDGLEPLTTKYGIPDTACGSDHLPIVFALDL